MIISTGIGEPAKNGVRYPSKELLLRWREKNDLDHWVRKERLVSDFNPYCYVHPNYVKVKDTKRMVPRSQVIDHIEDSFYGAEVEPQTDAVDANGDALYRINFESPNMVRKMSRELSGTYEADVPYEDRYLIDNVEEMPEYEPRKVFIDLEALQYPANSEGPKYLRRHNRIWADWQMINVIGCYDNYTNTYVIWTQHPEAQEHLHSFTQKTPVKMMNFDGVDVEIRDFPNEYSMLLDFVEWIDDIDPDMLLAWGMGFYDLPTLYARLESTGIGADKLSPSSLGKNRYVDAPSQYRKYQYNWTAQPIKGRIVISLDRLFERVYRDSKSTNLPSNKLDIVGQKLFGRGKTEFRPDFYDQDYHHFLEDYLYYNFRDVLLMVEIEEKYNLVNGQMALQRLAKCKFDSTFYGSNYARVYFMRKAAFKQRTGWYAKDTPDSAADKLQGAIVFDPEDLDSVGLHKNVGIFDFAGLYPSCMVASNCSWETKVKKGEEQDDDIIGDGCRFRKWPMGILPASVIELDELRDEYKAKRDEAGAKYGKTSDEFRKWDDAQKTVKRLRATFYGLMAFKGFAWGDMDIARTITKFGRDSLLSIKEESEKLGYQVIYGHTDSIFVKMGDDLSPEECVEKANELGDHLTKMMQEKLDSTAMIVDCEMLMDRFYLPRRNRYGGRVVWMPEVGFDIAKEAVEDRMKIQGLEAKHANTSPVGRGVQLRALHNIWDDMSPEEVKEDLLDYIQNIRDGKVEKTDLFARARLGKFLPTKKILFKVGKQIELPLLDESGKKQYKSTVVDGKIKKELITFPVDVAGTHYGEGATNPNASMNPDDDNAAYVVLDGVQRGAAWYNIVLAKENKLDKGDSFYTTFVKDGPTWIPAGGYVSFSEPEDIEDYEIDVEKIIEKHVVGKLDHIMYGIGLSLDDLRPTRKKLTVDDFFG